MFNNPAFENAIVTNGAAVALDPIPDLSPTPIPDIAPVPRLGASLVPEPLLDWLADISDRRCCPLEYPTVSALVALGGIIGTQAGIRPKRVDDWFLFPNLYALVIGDSGSQKTDGMADGLRFAEEFERDEAESFALRLPEIEAAALDRKIELDAIENQLKAVYSGKKPASTGGVVDREALKQRIQELKAIRPETPRRLLVSDGTVEKIGMLLNTNPNGLINVQDEISPFLDSLERIDKAGDLSFYLKAANGTGSESVDRVGRESFRVNNLCLSVIGGTQPARISKLIETTAAKSGDNGLLPRFGLMVYPDMVSAYQYTDTAPKAVQEARAIYKALRSIDPACPLYKRLDDGAGTLFVNFDEAAQIFFVRWLTEIESEIRTIGSIGSDIPASHISKYKGLMPKLALIFQLVDYVSGIDRTATGISLKNAELAADWIIFLKAHARRIYSPSTKTEYKNARLLLSRLEKGVLEHRFTARMVYRKQWRGLTTPADVATAIEVLLENGWLYPVEIKSAGKPKTEYIYFKNEAVRNH